MPDMFHKVAMKAVKLLNKTSPVSEADFFTELKQKISEHLQLTNDHTTDTFKKSTNQTEFVINKIGGKTTPFPSKVGKVDWLKRAMQFIGIILFTIIYLCICVKPLPCIYQCIMTNIIQKVCSRITQIIANRATTLSQNISQQDERSNDQRISQLQSMTDYNNNQLNLLLDGANRARPTTLDLINPNLSSRFKHLVATAPSISASSLEDLPRPPPFILSHEETGSVASIGLPPPPPPPLICLPLIKKLSRDEIIHLSDIPKQKNASQVKKEELTSDFENELKSSVAKRHQRKLSFCYASQPTLPKPVTKSSSAACYPTRLHNISQTDFKDSIKNPNLKSEKQPSKKVRFLNRSDLKESEL
jgi:hypothetical protein